MTTLGSAGQCLGSNGTAAVWTACGSGAGVTLQTNGTNNAVQTTLNLVAGSNITLSNASGGNVTISAASGALPASWSVTGATNAVTAAPAAGQDATTLTLAPSLASGGTADIFDVCSALPCSSGSKYFWITYNGNLGFSGNTLQIGSSNQATQSYLRLYGGSTPNAPAYLDLLDTTGSHRTDLFASVSTSGIACVSSSIPGADCGPTIASSNYLVSAAGGTAPATGDCVKWTSATQVGDAGSACGSGGGAALQTNGTNNISQTVLNLQNTSGISITNPSAGNVSITLSGLAEWTNGSPTGGGSLALAAANTVYVWSADIPAKVTFSNLTTYWPVADSTGLYDIGVYNLSGALLADVGPIHPNGQLPQINATKQGSVTLAPGSYLFALTGNAVAANYKSLGTSFFMNYCAGGAGTSSGGQLPATIAPPAAAMGYCTSIPGFAVN